MPPRRAPLVGAPVLIWFLARRVSGTIERVEEGGRRLVVATEEGEVMTFVLGRATGHFMQEGQAIGGARLTFLEDA
jgi:hypothetical protein